MILLRYSQEIQEERKNNNKHFSTVRKTCVADSIVHFYTDVSRIGEQTENVKHVADISIAFHEFPLLPRFS